MQKMYADFKGGFIHVLAGIHPNRPGNDSGLVLDTVLLSRIKEEVVAVAVEGFVEKVFAVDGQCGEDQAGALWRKIDHGRGYQARKRYAGVHIL